MSTVMEFEIIALVHLIALLGLLGGGVYIVAYQFGLIDWYKLNRKKWMPDFCGAFCYSFWFATWGLALLFALGFPFDWIYLLAPLPAAVLSRLVSK